MNEYWDKRYLAEGKIWGENPSLTAEHALKLFREQGYKTVLVPGSGYGRNTKLFSSSGLEVTGVEIAEEACRMARDYDPVTHTYNQSALEMSFLKDRYDCLYAFNVMHLFRAADRKDFIKQCHKRVRKNGLMFFTVFSEKEETYGKGAEVEKNTFESKPGRPVHYFTEEDIRKHFKGYKVIETGLMEDAENHGPGPHTHILRYLCVKNK